MTLPATVPYLDVPEADQFFAERLKSDGWDNASAADKTASLKMATRLLNDLHYIGQKTDEEQDNEWPRDANPIPFQIKQATAEVALALLNGFDPDTLEQQSQGKTSESTGDASVSYGADGLRALTKRNLGLPSPSAARLIRPFIIDRREFRLDRMG